MLALLLLKKKIIMFYLGFEAQIESSKALADDALSKLPIISGIIGKAVANNDKTQAILDQLGDYGDTLATLNKLNTSVAKVEVWEMGTVHLILHLSLNGLNDKMQVL